MNLESVSCFDIPVLLACFSRKALSTASGDDPDWLLLLVTAASLVRSCDRHNDINKRIYYWGNLSQFNSFSQHIDGTYPLFNTKVSLSCILSAGV